jgi:DUF1365 family protein
MKDPAQSSSADFVIHTGKVSHHRMEPSRSFTYKVCYFEYDSCTSFSSWLHGQGRGGLLFDFVPDAYFPLLEKGQKEEASLHQRIIEHYKTLAAMPDNNSGPAQGSRTNVRNTKNISRIRILTLPGQYGRVYNPVSFAFIYFNTGEKGSVDQEEFDVLAEVTNTFGERKIWLLPAGQARVQKDFYISPFLKSSGEMEFHVHKGSDELVVEVTTWENNRKHLMTRLFLNRIYQPTAGRLAWSWLRYFLHFRINWIRIHWQALVLWLRKIPWYSHKDDPSGVRYFHGRQAEYRKDAG